jgi:hypothetical protein
MPSRRYLCALPATTAVREPDTGNPYVRFDEGERVHRSLLDRLVSLCVLCRLCALPAEIVLPIWQVAETLPGDLKDRIADG